MSSNNYKISVVIAFCCKRYNQLNLLVNSINNQTYKADEVLIISDGPDSNLKENLISNSCKIYHAPKSGVPGPLRNLGILKSKNKYIAITDDDDIWHSRKLEYQIKAFKNYPNNSAVFTDCVIFENEQTVDLNAIISEKILVENIDFNSMYLKNMLPLSSVMINTDLSDNLFTTDKYFRAWEDYELWLRMLEKKNKIIKINLKLLFYRVNPGSMRNNFLLTMIYRQYNFLIKKSNPNFILKIKLTVLFFLRVIKFSIKGIRP
mgnify:CR=1 FL=1|tara:strand:+ start:12832 stop:13617 length:786 start_codon:yes stop_codon:yes gene_type:complete